MHPDNPSVEELAELRKVIMALRRNFPHLKDRLDVMVRLADEAVKLQNGFTCDVLLRTIEEGLRSLVR